MRDSEAQNQLDGIFCEQLISALPRLKARKNLSPSFKIFLRRIDKLVKQEVSEITLTKNTSDNLNGA